MVGQDTFHIDVTITITRPDIIHAADDELLLDELCAKCLGTPGRIRHHEFTQQSHQHSDQQTGL